MKRGLFIVAVVIIWPVSVILGMAITFVVGRWCAQLLGWY